MRDFSPDDCIAILLLVIGLLAPAVMITLWQVKGWFYPPAIVAIFLGISVATLTYRYLGGVEHSSFALGTIKITGSGALLLATFFLINPKLEGQMDIRNIPSKYQEALEQLKKYENDLKVSAGEINRLKKENDELNSRIESDLVAKLQALSPEDEPAASIIRNMPSTYEGPWRLKSTEKQLMVSVVGYLKNGGAAACSYLKYDYYPEVEITSLLSVDGRFFRTEGPIVVSNWQKIQDKYCGEGRQFDIQLGCDLAEQVFTSDVLGCDKKNDPAWKAGFSGVQPVSAQIRLGNGAQQASSP